MEFYTAADDMPTCLWPAADNKQCSSQHSSEQIYAELLETARLFQRQTRW